MCTYGSAAVLRARNEPDDVNGAESVILESLLMSVVHDYDSTSAQEQPKATRAVLAADTRAFCDDFPEDEWLTFGECVFQSKTQYPRMI